MKNIIFGIIGAVVIIGGILLYKNYKEDQKLIASFSELTPYRQDNVNQETQDIIEIGEKANISLSESDKKYIQKNVLEADAIGADAGIKSAVSQVPATAEIYNSFTGGNYGVSGVKNFCTGDTNNIQGLLDIINRYSKTQATCTVSPAFPAKTFTVTAASVTKSGFYCTDQNGFQGLIDSNSSQFKIGIQCK